VEQNHDKIWNKSFAYTEKIMTTGETKNLAPKEQIKNTRGTKIFHPQNKSRLQGGN
jgi:hypothetical protein